MTIATGANAPDFTLIADTGKTLRLSDQAGSPVVLFFYPQDDTEGCTIENIEFTQLAPKFAKLGVRLVGISPDTVESHCAFRDKYGLGVTLLADPERKAVEDYGVWGPKTTFGHEYVGLIRTTFLIATDGTIAQSWTVTRIKGHAQQVLDAARALVTSG